jgi:hypothetical protein
LKPALRLMTLYRLVIDEIQDGQPVTSYTRWIDAVEARGAENEEVCVTFSPRFEHIWLESKKLLFDSLAQTPAAIGLRSKYAIRLYAWAKDHLSVGTKRITLEELRTVLGLDPVKDTDGNVIREARLGAWANFRRVLAPRLDRSQKGPILCTRVAGEAVPGSKSNCPAARVRHRWLHTTRRQPQILRLFARRLLWSGRSFVRWKGRHWLL